ncbi:MAG: response regulator [bacterium]
MFRVRSTVWWLTLINKILIIDNEIIFCKALQYHLTERGYDIVICTSYREFQDQINLCQFDLIILDLNLRGISGFDLFKRIRAINPDVKVIVTSAYFDHGNIAKANELGAYECASKSTQLFHVLDQIIETM